MKRTLFLGTSPSCMTGVLLLSIAATANAQEGLDKYMQAAPQQQTEAITKNELFESLKLQYLTQSRRASGNPPRLSLAGNKNINAIAYVFSNDYSVHCDKARVSTYPTVPSFPENYHLAQQVLGAADTIIEMQYEQDSGRPTSPLASGQRRQSLINYVRNATFPCQQYAGQVKQFLDEFASESEKWKQAGVENAQRSQNQRSEAIAERTEALRSGQAEIQNLSDAALFYNATTGLSLMMNPKAQPDEKYYVTQGLLEKIEDGGDTLLAKFGDGYARIVHVSASKQHQGFLDNLRVGRNFNVVGRYVGNAEYMTVMGASKTVPVFEAAYLSQ